MIIATLCNTCLQRFELTISPSESHLVKEIVGEDLACTCPRLCGGRVPIIVGEDVKELAGSPALKNPLRLSAHELYKAIHGGGLPDEISLDPVFIAALLKSDRPLEVITEQDGKTIYLHEIRFKNVTLHLTSGPRGAVVLKVTKEKHHAEVPEEAGRDRG